MTSCYGTYTVGVNIKRGMVLSPNDEEVASSKKHTQVKTRVHKPYPISDQNGRNCYPISNQKRQKNHTLWRCTYLYSLYKGVTPPPPSGAKNALQIMCLAAYASKTNQDMMVIMIINNYVTAVFKVYSCVSQLLDFVRHLTISEFCILPINSTK